jgi:V/A-type H+-transporting ATPase subunit I
MAMLQMQRISIYALKKDRKPVLELLQRRGVLEISDSIAEDQVFQKMDVSQVRSSFERNINVAKEASQILSGYVSEQKSILSSFEGRKIVSLDEYSNFNSKLDDTLRIANQIINCNKGIAEGRADILKLEAQIEMLKPWTNLDIPLNFEGTKQTKCFIGTFPKEYSLELLYQELAEYMPLNIDIISASKEQTCVFILVTNSLQEKVYEKLRSLEFSLPSVSVDKAPAEQLEKYSNRVSRIQEEILSLESKIEAFASNREDLLFLQDYERMRSDKYQVLGQISQSKNIFIITGYIPERETKALREELEHKFMLSVEIETPTEEEDIPVLLKNNPFSGAVESVVEGFALPAKGEIDPTAVVSCFYYVLFGIMLADAGYGIIMTVACGYILYKYRRTMEVNTKKFMSMFLYCGISTTFWGIMFGSYFGDVFDVIATTYFGVTNVPIIPPLWFFPVNDPMRMLAFSMILGLIHIITGYLIKVFQLYQQKDYIGIFYDAVSWILLIISCTILLMSLDMIKNILGLTLVIPSSIKMLSGIIAILSALIIILTNGRESRNPFKRFLKGAYALYGITGILSDVLSYSRLLALGLASGIIGNVINKMAAMPAKSFGFVGVIIFIIILLFGHTLNIAINALGAYVHTNRLQYVEFFGKFYSGGGRSFNPFTMKTKYYKVKENVNNG